MSYFKELELDRTVELPTVAGETAVRLLYTLHFALNGSAIALEDKSEDPGSRWVAVNAEWIDLLGWTVDDLNEQLVNPFHPDDFDMMVEHNHFDLAAVYAVRIKKKGDENYEWYKLDAFSFVFNNRTFRVVIVEATE